jgi:hypothetical protein
LNQTGGAPCDLTLFSIQHAVCVGLDTLKLLAPTHCQSPGDFRSGVSLYLKGNIGTVGGTCIAVVGLQAAALLFACGLMCMRKDEMFDVYKDVNPE